MANLDEVSQRKLYHLRTEALSNLMDTTKNVLQDKPRSARALNRCSQVCFERAGTGEILPHMSIFDNPIFLGGHCPTECIDIDA